MGTIKPPAGPELVELVVAVEPPAPITEPVTLELLEPGAELSSPLHATKQVLNVMTHVPNAN
jgi:hypothetical protein